MKKGCLITVAIFFAICLLFGMCAPETQNETDASVSTTTPLSTTQNTTSTYESINESTSESTESTAQPTTEPTTQPTTTHATEQSTEPTHTHKYKAATCTNPKTCSCGETEGKANGHSWKSATCKEPKTCSVCGATSGSTAKHNYSKGKCKTCGDADPDYEEETMVWIPTKGGKKYHTHAGCSNMDDPKQVTEKEAKKRGFEPCKRCH